MQGNLFLKLLKTCPHPGENSKINFLFCITDLNDIITIFVRRRGPLQYYSRLNNPLPCTKCLFAFCYYMILLHVGKFVSVTQCCSSSPESDVSVGKSVAFELVMKKKLIHLYCILLFSINVFNLAPWAFIYFISTLKYGLYPLDVLSSNNFYNRQKY